MEKLVIRLNHSLTSAKDVVCLNSAFFSKPSRCCLALHIYSMDVADASVRIRHTTVREKCFNMYL